MIDRKLASEVMESPLEVIREKCELPESLIRYTETAETLHDVYENMNTDYVLSDLSSKKFTKLKLEFSDYLESCCEEFSLGAMLPQPGEGKGVTDSTLDDLTEDPWLHDEEECGDMCEVSPVLKDYINNPGSTFSEEVELAIEHMMGDIPDYGISDRMRRPMMDRALMKSKYRVARRMDAAPHIMRDIKGDLIGKEREIRALRRGGFANPGDDERCAQMEYDIDNLFRNEEEKRYFPKEPINEFPDKVPGFDSECGSNCDECGNGGCGTDECGDNCAPGSKPMSESSGVTLAVRPGDFSHQDRKSIGQQVKDLGKSVKRLGEDIGADIKADLNMLGRKLKTIEKHYKNTDDQFVPVRRLNGARTTLNNQNIKDSDIHMNRAERKEVNKASKYQNNSFGNRSVIMMNNQVPWFKYILSDNGGAEKKRHIEFEFSQKAAKYDKYYMAAIESRYNVMSPSLQDWVAKTYDSIKSGNGVSDDDNDQNDQNQNEGNQNNDNGGNEE